MQAATAYAHPNIALVKYWGKSSDELNIPATPSVALTLGGLRTTTRVAEASQDAVVLDGRVVHDAKLHAWLIRLRRQFALPPMRIESTSDFPANSGLASSASGFAALTVAISAAFELDLTLQEKCDWARQGSGSAARSLHGGFVALEPDERSCRVSQIKKAHDWDLYIVIAVTSKEAKSTGSTVGMTASRETSPYYDSWVNTTRNAYQEALQAINAKDFHALGEIAEASCRNMHALMLSTKPPLIYWNAATLACIREVEMLQAAGNNVFYTVDAGSHVKAVCELQHVAAVRDRFRELDGVYDVLLSPIGGAAKLFDGVEFRAGTN